MTPLRTAVLVEGASDQRAVLAVAAKYGRDLAADGADVVAMGGATNIGHVLAGLDDDVRVGGLVDEAQAGYVRRILTAAGRPTDGFFVCSADLEDELIRALGVPSMERLLESEGDLAAYDVFRHQPAQRDRTDEARLHRFLGTRSGRKIHYGRALVDALDVPTLPQPLRLLNAWM